MVELRRRGGGEGFVWDDLAEKWII